MYLVILLLADCTIRATHVLPLRLNIRYPAASLHWYQRHFTFQRPEGTTFSMANMDNAEANAHIAALTAENEALRAEVAENAAALAAAEALVKVLDKLPTTTIPGT